MRGIGTAAAAARRHTHLPSSYAAAFSSFSGIGGAGRGRGRGLPPSAPPRAPGSPIPDDDDGGADPFSAPKSGGRGRGESVIPPSPTIPSFSSFSGADRCRGSPLPLPPSSEDAPKQPTITKHFDDIPPPSDLEPPTPGASSSEAPRSLPTSGAGRGVPRMRQPVDAATCFHFYSQGWVTGTGGSITVKANDPSVPLAQQLIVMSPSGVQKERMVAEDMYVLSADGKVLSAPVAKPWPHKPPKCTDCAPLFMKAYLMRGAGAVIHSHGMETCIATMLDPGAKEFRVNQDKRQEFWPNQKKK